MEHKLVVAPNPILKEKCVRVKLPLSKEDKDLINEMYAFVKDPNKNAVGLAAPQFGETKRMFVIRYSDGKGHTAAIKAVNPFIIPQGKKNFHLDNGEGCLSEPNKKVVVNRYKNIVLSYVDADSGKNVTVRLGSVLAVIAQHEMDHLNGVLLEDYESK